MSAIPADVPPFAQIVPGSSPPEESARHVTNYTEASEGFVFRFILRKLDIRYLYGGDIIFKHMAKLSACDTFHTFKSDQTN